MEHDSGTLRARKIIEDLGIDLVEFVKEEMRQYPLLNRGWDETSLLALFRLEHELVEMDRFYYGQCSKEVYRLYKIKEEWWETFSLASGKLDRQVLIVRIAAQGPSAPSRSGMMQRAMSAKRKILKPLNDRICAGSVGSWRK